MYLSDTCMRSLYINAYMTPRSLHLTRRLAAASIQNSAKCALSFYLDFFTIRCTRVQLRALSLGLNPLSGVAAVAVALVWLCGVCARAAGALFTSTKAAVLFISISGFLLSVMDGLRGAANVFGAGMHSAWNTAYAGSVSRMS